MGVTSDSVYSGRTLRVLYVEDNPRDAKLCLKQLEQAGLKLKADVVNTPEEFAEKLRSEAYDIVLADFRMPGWSGMDALEVVRQYQEDMPFVLVTGTMGEEAAVECIKKGVTDYVLKDHLSRLPVALKRALNERQLRDEARQTHTALEVSETRARQQSIKDRKRAEEALNEIGRAS